MKPALLVGDEASSRVDVRESLASGLMKNQTLLNILGGLGTTPSILGYKRYENY